MAPLCLASSAVKNPHWTETMLSERLRTPMAKRNEPESKKQQKRRPKAGSLLLFLPFHLFNFLTRRMRQPGKFFIRAAAYPVIAGIMLATPIALVYGFRASRFDIAKVHAMPERTILVDRNGEVIGRIHGEKRQIVPLKNVAEDFRKAILAREDERFYHHGAFDPIGIARATLKNFQGKREGASTITQQLASDIYQLKRGERRGDLPRQLDRKLLEIFLAMRLEGAMTKDEILEAYINQINWGRQIKGVGEASRIYFEKHPEELTLSQSALLAGIVRGPDSFNPFRSIEAATRERDTTLERMVNARSITRERAEEAKKDAIEVRPESRRASLESYALDAIRRDLEVILEKEDIQLGGLEIVTTIDMRIQQKAEEAIEQQLASLEKNSGYKHQKRSDWLRIPEAERREPDYAQAATVVLDNRTGGVIAIVGGRNAKESRFNRAVQSNRQMGSLFKPFVYLAAFEEGLSPDAPISDGPLQPGEIKGAGTWRPRNSDGTFGGTHPASHGLIRSRNTMSVRVGNRAGLGKVSDLARAVGFDNMMPPNPSSFLGSWESTPWEIASAYSIFPNDGKRLRPYLISEIKDRDGNVLYSGLPLSYQAAEARPSNNVRRILEEVANRGTAASIRRLGFTKPCGGKTGTTNDYKDAWFSGFTSSLSCAVWVGMDQPKTTIDRGFGSVLALPIWVEIMKTADRLGYKAGKLDGTGRMVSSELCRLSGKRATAGCREAGTTVMEALNSDVALDPTDFCPIHPARAAAVDPNTPRAEIIDEPVPRAQAVPAPAETPRKATTVAEAPLRAIPVE